MRTHREQSSDSIFRLALSRDLTRIRHGREDTMASKKVSSADALLTAAAALTKREIQQLGFDPLGAKRSCRKGLETIEEYK